MKTRPKELPYSQLSVYRQVIYGLRFLYQLWPVWLTFLFWHPFDAWWLDLARQQTGKNAVIVWWAAPFAKIAAVAAMVWVANTMKRMALANWNTVDAAMAALIVTMGRLAWQSATQAGFPGGFNPMNFQADGNLYQAVTLILLFITLLSMGIRAPFDKWMTHMTEPMHEAAPVIEGKITAPAPAQLRDVDAAQLSKDLSRRVIGQSLIADQLSRSIARRLQQRRRGKPVFTGLFAGPTGVGKTEMAKALAAALLGNEKTLFRVDCGNVLGEAGLQTLIGAPTGYMGSDKVGTLTAHVQRYPNAVLLFDEIEKAGGAQGQQSPLFRLLLSLLDEGRFTEQSNGQAVDATGCVILMTSNAGHKALGGIYEQYKNDPAALTRATKDELQGTFAPEFLARIDLVTSFSPLDADARGAVIAAHIGRIARQYDMSVGKIDAGLINRALVQWQALEAYGAREVLRWLEDTIADPLIAARKQGLKTVNLVWSGDQAQAMAA